MQKQVALNLIVLMMFFSGCTQNNYVEERVGIQLYSLRKQFANDVPGTLAQIKSWGITVIEGGDNTYGMEESKFISLLKEHGLKTTSVGASFEELRDNPEKSLQRAKSFGASYVMCAWISHKDNHFNIENAKNALEVFNKAGKILNEGGITLVYHPHGYEFKPYLDGTMFDYMAKNAKNFDFEMDVYWVKHGGEDPMTLFERYPDKFKLMHLKDMKKGTVGNTTGHGDVEDNVVLGTGMIAMEALFLKGKELGVEYMFIEDESSNVLAQVPLSIEFVKKIKLP